MARYKPVVRDGIFLPVIPSEQIQPGTSSSLLITSLTTNSICRHWMPGSITTKHMNPAHDLICQYRTALNRIQLAYATLILWNYPDTPDVFDAIHDAMDPKLHLFPEIKRLIHDEKTMKIACNDLYTLAYRSALTDLFPRTKAYCHATGQTDKLKAQPWFAFWRILRNCFAHEMVFNFNPAERAMLPVTWSGATIDNSMNRKPLTHGQMSYAKMHELIEAAQSFLLRDLA